jgi:ATPase subunit of ABC transporter with duplicated ATPase domains
VRPEAKSYYSLDATQFKFSFPEPGYLEGVKTKDKAILKLMNVTFAYPGATTNILNDVTLYVTLSSRIAVTGANGAGACAWAEAVHCAAPLRYPAPSPLCRCRQVDAY